jgi:hypothetical protein
MERAAELWMHVGGWGSTYPRVLLVGDRYNGDREAALPFSNKNGASRTLSELLSHAGMSEDHVYLVNAYHANGTAWLTRTMIAHVAARVIVAFGHDAFERLEEIGEPSFVTFPHPQFLGRFKYDELARWGAKLRKLVEHVL